jgi:hypothetical protein
MTLILTCLTHEHIVQVADRRLTMPDGTLYDDDTNKAVFYCGRVAVAYTGLALNGREAHSGVDWVVHEGRSGNEVGHESRSRTCRTSFPANQRTRQEACGSGDWMGDASGGATASTLHLCGFKLYDRLMGVDAFRLRADGCPDDFLGREFLTSRLSRWTEPHSWRGSPPQTSRATRSRAWRHGEGAGPSFREYGSVCGVRW